MRHVVVQGVPKARLPERAEEVENPTLVLVNVREALSGLEHPALGGDSDFVGSGGGEHDLGDGGKIGVEPLGERDAVDRQGVKRLAASRILLGDGVVEQEEHAVFALVRQQSVGAVAVEEKGAVQLFGAVDRNDAERRPVDGILGGERFVAKRVKGVGESVGQFLEKKVTGRLVLQVENDQFIHRMLRAQGLLVSGKPLRLFLFPLSF